MKRGTRIVLFCSFIIFVSSCSRTHDVRVFYTSDAPQVKYGVERLTKYFQAKDYRLLVNREKETAKGHCIHILTPQTKSGTDELLIRGNIEGIEPDGYKIIKSSTHIYILATTDNGSLYGIMDLIEQMSSGLEWDQLEARQQNPALSFRAIKFNLPWSPYRPGPANDLHAGTCRDLSYWEAFLDMMVENRFNALTLWNAHPFPFLIRAKNYPAATPFSDEQLDEWKSFWKSLFAMAKERGIQTYLVNWNIVVSPEFAKHYGALERDDRSGLVKKYTRESVTQVINEYKDLTGLGVTLADWMGNWGDDKMTPKEREDWIEETFVAGMKAADRKIRFIHRAVLAGDPAEMRRVIDNAELPDKAIVEIKFNWSHGHSAPRLSLTHNNDQGSIMKDIWDPKPENYFVAWTIRNEDFFVLRWGEPDFIREHIRINDQDYVDGYFIGSEGYIPAKDYSRATDDRLSWKYAFEKQWMFYHLWGRLLYDPAESNQTLAKAVQIRYGNTDATQVLRAYQLASRVPLRLASFYKATWDFTLYSEGFLAPWQYGFDDQKSPFISIEELIRHETLDPQYLSITDFANAEAAGRKIGEEAITPLELAETVEEECREAIMITRRLRSATGTSPDLLSELEDLETWSHLGFYFADKLRAGVALARYNSTGQGKEKDDALNWLLRCRDHWQRVIELTEERYVPMPYVSFGHHEPRWPGFTAFHWKHFRDDVEADITFVEGL